MESVMDSSNIDPNSPLLNKLLTFQTGRLDIVMGPMRSGKSTRMISSLGTYADVGLRVLYINHSIDTRVSNGDSVCSTHHSNYSKLSSKIVAVKTTQLCDIDIERYHVIGVDEFQFFDISAVKTIQSWVTQNQKIVLCCGLDGDFERNRFGYLLDLIPFADTVEKLSARCMRCLELGLDSHVRASIVPAPFTGKVSSNRDQIEVGIDQYISLCRYHYDELSTTIHL